jgi:hypothetical protein
MAYNKDKHADKNTIGKRLLRATARGLFPNTYARARDWSDWASGIGKYAENETAYQGTQRREAEKRRERRARSRNSESED